jgi:hypothetical protein
MKLQVHGVWRCCRVQQLLFAKVNRSPVLMGMAQRQDSAVAFFRLWRLSGQKVGRCVGHTLRTGCT